MFWKVPVFFDSIVKEGKSRAENDVRNFHHKRAQQQAMSVCFFFVCVVNQNRFSHEWERACCCYCCASDECELCPSPTVNRLSIDSCICNEFVFSDDIGVLSRPVACFLMNLFFLSYNVLRFCGCLLYYKYYEESRVWKSLSRLQKM